MFFSCDVKRIIFVLLLLVLVISLISPSCKPANNGEASDFDYSKLKCERFQLETKLLNDVWGSSPSNVFVVGENGAIYHGISNSWEKMDSNTSATIYGVWGTASSNIYAVTSEGNILHFDGSVWTTIAKYEAYPLADIWGTSESDIFVVGFSGIILHYDGHDWNSMKNDNTNHLLNIWGTSSSNIYAVGIHETILHYDGVNWNVISSDENNDRMYTGIWGSDANNIFVTRGMHEASILHYDGHAWNDIKINMQYYLGRISGSSSSNIFAVGSNGNIMHFNGKHWKQIGDSEANFNDSYSGVWTYSLTDTFIVGMDGVILHYYYK